MLSKSLILHNGGHGKLPRKYPRGESLFSVFYPRPTNPYPIMKIHATYTREPKGLSSHSSTSFNKDNGTLDYTALLFLHDMDIFIPQKHLLPKHPRND